MTNLYFPELRMLGGYLKQILLITTFNTYFYLDTENKVIERCKNGVQVEIISVPFVWREALFRETFHERKV